MFNKYLKAHQSLMNLDISINKNIYTKHIINIRKFTMEYLTSAVFSGIVYDLLKTNIQISANLLKDRLKGWLIDDNELRSLSERINSINNATEMSEKALEKQFDNDPLVKQILINTKQNNSNNTITQNHTGEGDNVAGNKVVNNNR